MQKHPGCRTIPGVPFAVTYRDAAWLLWRPSTASPDDGANSRTASGRGVGVEADAVLLREGEHKRNASEAVLAQASSWRP